ncbi:hypothetical protein [Thioalkalivibrio sp. AKL8]|uniref:hypothetical protein n=1 Tax=Thioalkalivibrio sp. AKL8 TaxID=1158156 RepID=UPI00037E44BB|nr:hypothetical protein [Thioalkalivibrio sp. AKL8]
MYLLLVGEGLSVGVLWGPGFACVAFEVAGPLVVVFGAGGLGSAAGVVMRFVAALDSLGVLVVSFGVGLLGAYVFDRLAGLGTRGVALLALLATLLGGLAAFGGAVDEVVFALVGRVSAILDGVAAACLAVPFCFWVVS